MNGKKVIKNLYPWRTLSTSVRREKLKKSPPTYNIGYVTSVTLLIAPTPPTHIHHHTGYVSGAQPLTSTHTSPHLPSLTHPHQHQFTSLTPTHVTIK